jgi:hypothetical protein
LCGVQHAERVRRHLSFSNVCAIRVVTVDASNTQTVTGTVSTGCVCICRNKWDGSTCSVCRANYNSASACGTCAAGFIGYPICSPLCTKAGNCSGNAQQVTGTYAQGCTCTCYRNWTSSNCAVCSPGHHNTFGGSKTSSQSFTTSLSQVETLTTSSSTPLTAADVVHHHS